MIGRHNYLHCAVHNILLGRCSLQPFSRFGSSHYLKSNITSYKSHNTDLFGARRTRACYIVMVCHAHFLQKVYLSYENWAWHRHDDDRSLTVLFKFDLEINYWLPMCAIITWSGQGGLNSPLRRSSLVWSINYKQGQNFLKKSPWNKEMDFKN